MIDIAAGGNENEQLVLQLIRSMETGTLPDTVRSLCSAEFSWENSGLPPIRGQDALFDHMAAGGFASQIPILATMTHFSADLLHIASNGPVVFTERVDHHWDEAGRDLMTPHICGVAEVRDGKIQAFRDFYDVACYQQQPTAPQAGFDLGSWRASNHQA